MQKSLFIRFALTSMLAFAVAATGCSSDGGGGGAGTGGGGSGGDGGIGGDGGMGGGGTGGMGGGGTGGMGGGGTGGVGGVVDISDIDQLDALIQAGLPLVAAIQSVTVSSPPVVEFTLQTQNGIGVIGVAEGAVRGTFAKLLPPASANESSQWISYINNLATGTGDSPALPQALQATREEGPLVDNGDGSYQFTYTTDVTSVTDPVPVSWEPGNTTRAGLEIRIASELNPDNPHYDFVPNGGAGTGTKAIAPTNLCNNCHQRLALHGGARFTEDYCVTCHNDGTRDPEGGESVSMAYMTHSIHGSAVRDAQDEPYIVIGRGGSVHDYSHVTYPQDVRECQNCHNEDDAADGDAWAEEVNALACGGCHAARLVEVSTDATTGIGTYGIEHIINDQSTILENAACLNCHNNPTVFPDLITSLRHAIPELIAAQDFRYEIIDATDTDVGQTPKVTFQIVNPNAADAPYDLKYDDGGPFDAATFGGDTRLAIDIAWPSNDYTNVGTGSAAPAGPRPGAPAQVVSLNPLASDGGNPAESVCENAATDDGCVNNGNGTYTIESTVEVPSGLTGGSLAVAMEGHPYVDGEVPATGAVAYFEISAAGGPGEAREMAVSLEKCASCHGSLLSLHGSNRTNNLELCVTCHNANATDIRARSGDFGGPIVPGETSIDFTTMIHGIHAANIVVFGFGGSTHDYTEVTYPGELNNCAACHTDDGYYPTDPSVDFRLAKTFVSDNFDNEDFPEDVVPSAPGSAERLATLANQEDDLNVTANAAACLQCHTSQTAASHALVPGGAKLSVKQADDGTLIAPPGDPVPDQVETCTLCHGQGSSVADVGIFHRPWFPLP